jgi:NADPH-dependent 2,4-dienoyl-CoA reductase/sulfur reductase-like enzyme
MKSTMPDSCKVMITQAAPRLADAGALVLEGTLAGCVLAWQLARRGCRTVLATSSASLPHELVVVRQPWTSPEQWQTLPEPFQEAMHRSVASTPSSGITLLNLSKLAVGVEDLLLDAGVRVFYGLSPVGIEQARNGALCHVILGGKGGLHAIAAQRVIDCTLPASVAALAGARLSPRLKRGQAAIVRLACKVKQQDRPGPLVITRGQISDDKLSDVTDTHLDASAVSELVDGRVPLHGPFAQVTLRLPVDVTDPLWPARLTVATRQTLVRIGRCVNEARLAAGKTAIYFHRFSGGLVTEPILRVTSAGRSAPHAVRGCSNLWVCGPAADVSDDAAADLADPFRAVRATAALADEVLAGDARHAGKGDVILTRHAAAAGRPAGELRFSDAAALHVRDHLELGPTTLPIVAGGEVLVAGAGTSGVPAALSAAKAQARTVIVEQQADVGGVRTVGGVGSYWFGRVTPFQKQCDDQYDQVTGPSGMAEEVAMLQCLLDAGVQVLVNGPVVGAVVQKDRVSGIVIGTAAGLALVTGDMLVDATGDGDVAAWAGAPFDYGTGRDACTLWGSFGNFNAQKRTANRQYESTVEVRDPWDLTRNIVRGRRRPGMWKSLDHEMPQHYLTPRESRRLRGSETVTYSGILAGQTFDDLMIVCESNFDIKGLASSDIGACGVISSWDVYRKFQAAVPWRAVVPPGLANVLVAGRAYSASHDAIALARMQRDMVSLGGAAARAAAHCAQRGITPDQLDVSELQQAWLALGTLRDDDFKRYAKPWRYTAREAQRDCQRLLARRGSWSIPLARLMRSSVSLPALRQSLKQCTHELTKVRIARALAFLGDARGVPLLLKSIEAQIAKGLPRPLKRCLAIPPEHGWAGEPVYSLRAIGYASAAVQAVTLMVTIARKVEDSAERFASKLDSQFEYVLAICALADRSPSPAMIPPLEALLRKRCLTNQHFTVDRDLRFSEDPVQERRAYLEMAIGRALARCADPRGYEILLRYCDDFRGTLARSARDELAELIGQSLPGDALARRRIVERHLPRAACVPFTRRLD